MRSRELLYLPGATAPTRAASSAPSRSTSTRCRARRAATWPTTSWPPMMLDGRRAGTATADAALERRRCSWPSRASGAGPRRLRVARRGARRLTRPGVQCIVCGGPGAASWYTGGACWRYRGDAALRSVLRDYAKYMFLASLDSRRHSLFHSRRGPGAGATDAWGGAVAGTGARGAASVASLAGAHRSKILRCLPRDRASGVDGLE